MDLDQLRKLAGISPPTDNILNENTDSSGKIVVFDDVETASEYVAVSSNNEDDIDTDEIEGDIELSTNDPMQDATAWMDEPGALDEPADMLTSEEDPSLVDDDDDIAFDEPADEFSMEPEAPADAMPADEFSMEPEAPTDAMPADVTDVDTADTWEELWAEWEARGVERPSNDGEVEEDIDISNGYNDVQDHEELGDYGDDYFPNGNTSTAPERVGPSAAKHGNNPMAAKQFTEDADVQNCATCDGDAYANDGTECPDCDGTGNDSSNGSMCEGTNRIHENLVYRYRAFKKQS